MNFNIHRFGGMCVCVNRSCSDTEVQLQSPEDSCCFLSFVPLEKGVDLEAVDVAV